MGKTNKPILILCIGIEETAELKALAEQGHTIEYDHSYRHDVIIGPQCWRWLPGISEKWLPQLLKEVRAAQPIKPKKVKSKKASDGTTTG